MPWVTRMLMVWAATAIGLIPLAWLTFRRERFAAHWWWLAVAFAVSFVADVVALSQPKWDRWWLTLVYPVAQSGLIGAVLIASRFRAALYVLALAVTALVVVLTRGVHGPDVILDVVASLGVVAIVLLGKELPARLRLCLAVYFGLGWATWLIHARWLVVPTWYPYQSTRLAGSLLFCWAAIGPERSLKVV